MYLSSNAMLLFVNNVISYFKWAEVSLLHRRKSVVNTIPDDETGSPKTCFFCFTDPS